MKACRRGRCRLRGSALSAIKIEVPVWLITSFGGQRQHRRNLPSDAKARSHLTVSQECVIELGFSSVIIAKVVAYPKICFLDIRAQVQRKIF